MDYKMEQHFLQCSTHLFDSSENFGDKKSDTSTQFIHNQLLRTQLPENKDLRITKTGTTKHVQKAKEE